MSILQWSAPTVTKWRVPLATHSAHAPAAAADASAGHQLKPGQFAESSDLQARATKLLCAAAVPGPAHCLRIHGFYIHGPSEWPGRGKVWDAGHEKMVAGMALLDMKQKGGAGEKHGSVSTMIHGNGEARARIPLWCQVGSKEGLCAKTSWMLMQWQEHSRHVNGGGHERVCMRQRDRRGLRNMESWRGRPSARANGNDGRFKKGRSCQM